MTQTKRQRLIRFLEFLFIGVAMGLVEDLLAIVLATDAEIEPQVVLIVLLVAIPFAALSELVVDHPNFWERLMPRRWFPKNWVVPRQLQDKEKMHNSNDAEIKAEK